jgi:hypothetical protein
MDEAFNVHRSPFTVHRSPFGVSAFNGEEDSPRGHKGNMELDKPISRAIPISENLQKPWRPPLTFATFV